MFPTLNLGSLRASFNGQERHTLERVYYLYILGIPGTPKGHIYIYIYKVRSTQRKRTQGPMPLLGPVLSKYLFQGTVECDFKSDR